MALDISTLKANIAALASTVDTALTELQPGVTQADIDGMAADVKAQADKLAAAATPPAPAPAPTA